MKTIAELMRGTSLPVWAGENGGDPAPADPKPDPVPPADPAPSDPPADPPVEPTPAPPVEAKKPDWRENEIARLRSQLERERAKEPKAADPKPAVAPAQPDADFESRVATAAEQRTQILAFNKACSDAAKSGRETYGEDFVSRLSEITSKLVDLKDPVSAMKYNLFLKDAIEAADGDSGVVAKIVYELGGDLDEADRVMNLSPVKRGIELSKLSAREAKQISSAPQPITPVSARGDKHETIKPSDPTRSDTLSTASWMERRNAEVKAQDESRGYRR